VYNQYRKNDKTDDLRGRGKEAYMAINGVSAYQSYASSIGATSTAKTDTKEKTDKKEAYSGQAAVYEKSDKKLSEADRSALVAKLKEDSDKRVTQFKSLVLNMFKKQGLSFKTAEGTIDEDAMYKKLASGDFEVDEETKRQAQEDISEDGYWGVAKTSDRMLDFAKALTGGDADKMKEMVKAFDRGYQEATKTWGKDLPSISSDTRKATLEKFDKWFADQGLDTTSEKILNS